MIRLIIFKILALAIIFTTTTVVWGVASGASLRPAAVIERGRASNGRTILGLVQNSNELNQQLKTIKLTQRQAMDSLKRSLKDLDAETLEAARSNIASLGLRSDVLEEINRILSARLNSQGRENLASLIIFLKDNFGINVKGQDVKTARLDGQVFVVVGYHVTSAHAENLFNAVRPLLPPIPKIASTSDDIPEVVIHFENIHKDVLKPLTTELLKYGRIKSPDDTEQILRVYNKIKGKIREAVQKDNRALERGDEESTWAKARDPFYRGLDAAVRRLREDGYRIRVLQEDPEPLTWWLWERSEELFQEAAQAFVHGDVDEVERLSKRAEEMRYRADQNRDFKEEGPRINRAIQNLPKATHIIFRGLIHDCIKDALQIPSERKYLIRVVPRPEDYERYLLPMNRLHRLRREGKIPVSQEVQLQQQLVLQDSLLNFIASPLLEAGKDVVEFALLLNTTISRLSADDIRRVIRSFQNPPYPAEMQERVYEVFYRVKANFPNIFSEGDYLTKGIEASIKTVYGRDYSPASTRIPISDETNNASELSKKRYEELLTKI